MDALAFVESAPRLKAQPVYVLHGDEDFLKRQALTALKLVVLGPAEDSLGFSAHPGDKATLAAVREELDTVPFLASRRLVVVEDADPLSRVSGPRWRNTLPSLPPPECWSWRS